MGVFEQAGGAGGGAGGVKKISHFVEDKSRSSLYALSLACDRARQFGKLIVNNWLA